MVLEPEVERKLIVLEHAIRDIDERMAEIYRDGAGVSIAQLDLVKKFSSDLQATKRATSALKSRLDALEVRVAPAEQVAGLSKEMRTLVRNMRALQDQVAGLQENTAHQLAAIRKDQVAGLLLLQ